MEKMNKVDMGYLRVVATKRGVFKDCVITDLSFTSLDVPAGLNNIDNEQCYLVKKSDLDAYMARKESLEKMNCTPVYGENQRLTAKVKALEAEDANLRDINKSLREANSKLTEENEALKDAIDEYYYGVCSPKCELKAANEKLAAEVDDLKEKIKELGVIKSFLEVGNEKWIVCNTELKSRNRNLELQNAKLSGELSRADDELAKYSGVQEVIDIRTTCDQDSYVLWWTGRNGDEHKLELKLVQNPMSEKMRREMDIYDPTRT